MSSLSEGELVHGLAFAVMDALEKMSTAQVPILKPDLPSFTSCDFRIGIRDDTCVAMFRFKESGIPSGGEMDAELLQSILGTIGERRSYEELSKEKSLSNFYDWDRLLVLGRITNGKLDWPAFVDELVKWANDMPLARAAKINEARILSTIPKPPTFSLEEIRQALWVIECEDTFAQGTAFELQDYGVVTNEHVISGSDSIFAIRPSFPSVRHSVMVKKKNAALDLAIVDILDASTSQPLRASTSELNQMDHVAVCGFPNFQPGDSGILSPGLVVGSRNRSGVRRLLTNAGIVAGMSGGPVIGTDNRVVGICATGSDSMQEARETEDQSIIPVAALELLNRDGFE